MPRTLKKSCRDCGSTTRALKAPGPRCATCLRTLKKAQKRAAHGRWILKTYGLTLEQYEALYEAQGGVCYICRRATGKVKRLAVDHDHRSGFVRGLCCSTCNKILAHFRDDPEAGWRVFKYLEYPPAFDVIGKVKPDGTD
ncbi:MAG TPA: endonuclease VII domain-containing protein [Candidatus Paceibacterota bacterium]